MSNVVKAECVVGEAQKYCHCINGIVYLLDLPVVKTNSPQNKLKLKQKLHHFVHVEDQKVHNAEHVHVKENVSNQIQQFVGVQLVLGVGGEKVALQFAHYVREISILVARVEHQRNTQRKHRKRISAVRIFAQRKTKAEL
jgi:hypothetical protein